MGQWDGQSTNKTNYPYQQTDAPTSSVVLGSAAPVTVDAGPNAVGTSAAASHEDHKHTVLTSVAAPRAINPGVGNAGSSTALARADHDHPATLFDDTQPGLVGQMLVSTPARTFENPFQPSLTRPVLCSYTIELLISAGSAGDLKVQLQSDAAAAPATVRAVVALKFDNSAGIGDLVTQAQLTYLCPPEDYVDLEDFGVSGGATLTITQQVEISL
jgi:hypothetical protein